MSVVVVGVDHQSAALELLERVAVSGERLEQALGMLAKSTHIAESVVLSTCMRTEIYVDAVRFHAALDDVFDVLAHLADTSSGVLREQLFQLHDEEAYEHLFRVSAGLESAVIGESEVLGQVARAWEHARVFGTCRSVMGALFRHAVGAGKRVRTETAITRGITSIGQAAVVMTQEAIGPLQGKRVAVIGAGEMGESIGATLSRVDGIAGIAVVNRTKSRAEELAGRIGGNAFDFSCFSEILTNADIVLSSTGASEFVVGMETIEQVMAKREGHPLVLVDLAVPRDVDPRVSKIENVVLLDLDNLRAFTAKGRESRGREAVIAENIIVEELRTYCADTSARLVAPVVAELRAQAESIRLAELNGIRGYFTPEQSEAVNAMTKAMIAKFLHQPTIRLKSAAGTPEGDRMAEALRLLFEV